MVNPKLDRLNYCANTTLGEGLGLAPSSKRPWMVVVPFSLPGEKVRAKIYRNARLHSFAHFLSVERENPELRDMKRVGCKYFEKCGGCQYQVCRTAAPVGLSDLIVMQMLSYETQLGWKRDVIVRAYKNFSGA